MRLTATYPAQLVAADEPGDTAPRATGTIVPYGVSGDTSIGQVAVAAGALELPADVTRVKLFHGHDRERPVAHLAEAVDTADGLTGTFRYASTPAALQAAAELADKVRDGLSVELSHVELDDTTTPPTVTAARLDGVGQVPIPAFGDARAELAAEATDPDPEPEETMTDTDAPVAAPAEEPLTAAPPPPAAQAARPATTSPVSYAMLLAEQVSGAYHRGGHTAAGNVLTAALADITPGGNGAGNEIAAIGYQAAGELLDEVDPPMYERCVVGRTLTGMKVHGWRWSVPPEVDDYAGDKAEVPTNAATMEYVETDAARIAGAHDIDRIYVDLGSSAALVSYWRLMVADTALKLDAKRLALVQTDAATGASATITDALVAGVQAVPNATYWIVSSDLWAAEAAKAADTLPAILTGDGLFGGGLPGDPIVSDDLVSTVIVGRRSAREFYTLGDPPIRLEALNIANAGIDAGAYSYWAGLATSPTGVYVDTVTPVLRSASSRKSD